jgi:hypothetical protein
MRLGTELTQQVCSRCKSKLSIPVVFRDGEWWHQKCYKETPRLLVNTVRFSNALPGIFLRVREHQELL